jgi:recombination protein RecT
MRGAHLLVGDARREALAPRLRRDIALRDVSRRFTLQEGRLPMTSAIAVYSAPDQVRRDLEVLRPQMTDVLPRTIDADRFARLVVKAVVSNPKLMQCTRTSILTSVMEAAQLGLEPTGTLGSAYLVPYRATVVVPHPTNPNATVKQSVLEAKLIPGYRGLIDLARRSGEIDAIEADVVRQRDHFRLVKGTDSRLEHEPFIPDPSAPPEDRDPGPIVGAYMKATLRGGHEQYEWMSYDQIEGVRRRSRAADDGPWITDYSEMARKTVVRRGSKYLPLTTEFRQALALDEEAERAADPLSASVQSTSGGASRAAQMLLDRAARGNGEDAGSVIVEGEESTPDQSGAPDRSSPGQGLSEREEPPATRELRNVIEAREAEGTDGPSTLEAQAESEGRPTDICGAVAPVDANGETMGVCTRMPDHPAGHRNEAGAWPRGKR